MTAEQIQFIKRIVTDAVASGIGAAGMIQQIFFADKPDTGLILLFLGILLAPGILAGSSIVSSNRGNSAPTTASGSSSPPPSQSSSSSSSS